MSDDIVLITGATSGFGFATAERLVKNGYKVIATGRRKENLEKLKAVCNSENLFIKTLDMMALQDVEDFPDSLPGDFKNISKLVNNAGLALGISPAQDSSMSQWKQMIDTNITGLAAITHNLLPTIIKNKGHIINISSVAGSYPYPGGNVYGGTKAFVSQFSLGLRSDLHGTGVRVTSIEPGMAETEFTLVRTSGNAEASKKLYEGLTPLSGENIAETIQWLFQLPKHVNINRLEMMPVNQSFAPFQVYRDNE